MSRTCITKGLFVTGTDTGVGKTLVAAGLVRLARMHGVAAVAVKPLETGCSLQEGILYPEDGAFLRDAAERALTLDECAPYRFSLPAAPARAAEAEGRVLDLALIEQHIRLLEGRWDLVVVEGAGGLMVPIDGKLMMIDLIQRLGYPTLLVARSRLGTINHTLLSVAALHQRSLAVAGIVLSVSAGEAGPEEEHTPADIARMVDEIPVVMVPYLTAEERSDPSRIAAILERNWKREVWSRWIGGGESHVPG
ncbi:MAG: dethiobiotin synthase [Desulfomonile tiedjei]|nr:dethiobiotin synthase [Desulfomonile tiedjei]